MGLWSLPALAGEPAGAAPNVPLPAAAAESQAVTPVTPDTTPDIAPEIELLSDRQLTDMAADWESLDEGQRTELIQETRERMKPDQSPAMSLVRQPRGSAPTPAAVPEVAGSATRSTLQRGQLVQGGQSGQPGATQRIERRRFGRLVRQPDGSVLRIETEVVRIARRDPKRAYGVGFEQRHRPAGQGGMQAGQTPVARNPVARNPAESQPVQAQPERVAPAPQRRNVLTVQDPGS